MLPAGDDDSNADSDLVASLLVQHRRKQQHKSDVKALLLGAPCVAQAAVTPPQLSANDFEKQARAFDLKRSERTYAAYLTELDAGGEFHLAPSLTPLSRAALRHPFMLTVPNHLPSG
jgi:hypothetical protein